MIYRYVLAYDFSTARNKHIICKRERLAEVSEACAIHHVPYLHLARRMRKKMHASESGSDSQCRSDTDSVFIDSVLWSMAMHVS